MAAPSLVIKSIDTKPIAGQAMGTSGLRKKVTEVAQGNFLPNFIQAILNSLTPEVKKGPLLICGDGRFHNKEALQIILRIFAGNGVEHALVAQHGMASTPAGSAIIRARKCTGGILLTASHNPGGPHGDFGVKFNTSNGGPAMTDLTDEIGRQSQKVSVVHMAELPTVNIDEIGEQKFGSFSVSIIDPVVDYLALIRASFNVPLIREFLAKRKLKVLIDSLHAVTGVYTPKIFIDELGLPASCLRNQIPKEDFGGGHPDPNLTYAKALVDLMYSGEYDLGAAFDGDGDRNLILGKKFFVTPSDSLAVLAANWHKIPYFSQKGFNGVARSMPTSAAVDRVVQAFAAEGTPVNFYETPTGWKFFGNLMDVGKLSLCGEESFGTGSDIIREKDGIWAIMAWLNVLAEFNKNSDKLVTVADIVTNHWLKYGRNYYSRYDYEEVTMESAQQMMAHLAKIQASGELDNVKLNGYALKVADNFSYTDPVDKSVAKNQGIRFVFEDGTRMIFRLSGTGSVGATIRVYFDMYEGNPEKLNLDVQIALKPLITLALEWSKISQFTGRNQPTVIT